MRRKSLPAFILTFSIITILLMGIHVPATMKDMDNRTPVNIEVTDAKTIDGSEIDQAQPPNSLDIITDTVELIDLIRRLEGINLTSWVDDETVYTGLSGGIAGIGMQLLQARRNNPSSLPSDVLNLMLTTAEQLGYLLNDTAVVNTTHSAWNISRSDPFVDFGWDFGLAGIAAFYTELYNQTELPEFLTAANKTLTMIWDSVNVTTGLSFHSKMGKFLTNTTRFPTTERWYPTIGNEIGWVPGSSEFNGISFGTAGIAKSALNFLRYTNSTNTVVAEQLVNESIIWLENQFDVNGTERSIDIKVQYPGLKSTSIATGVAGVMDLYLDLYTYYNNDTYLDHAKEMASWLRGDLEDQPRFIYTFEENDSLIIDRYILGKTHGIAGTADAMIKLAMVTSNDTDINAARSAVNRVVNLGSETSEFVQYAEYVNSAGAQRSGSTSAAYGTGGIYAILFDAANYLNDSSIKSFSYKAKAFLLDQVVSSDGYNVIQTSWTESVDLNPSIGYPGALSYLDRLIPGILQVDVSSLDFGDVRQNEIETSYVPIKNQGEEVISPTWNVLESPFSTQNQSVSLIGRETKSVPVTFSAIGEQVYSENMTITAGSISTTVSLIGASFDLPTLTIIEGLSSDTTLDNKDPIYFEVESTDFSGISNVFFSVNDGQASQMSSISGTSRYNYTWTPNLENGTYEITIESVDTIGHSNSISFDVTIGVYTTPIVERVFSTTTIYILAGVTGLMVLAAIFVTRRYMS